MAARGIVPGQRLTLHLLQGQLSWGGRVRRRAEQPSGQGEDRLTVIGGYQFHPGAIARDALRA